jgi:L-arabinose isomerase
MDPRRPRIAIVHPYWTLWEHTAPPTFRDDRMALAGRVAATLVDSFEPILVGEVAGAGEGAQLGSQLAGEAPDAVLVLQTMAVPPAFVLALIDALPGVPVVIWALHETGLVGERVDHRTITTAGATVGAPMLSNALVRQERPFEMILGRLADPDTDARVRNALRLAAVAHGIRNARVGRVGSPVEGYVHVDVEDAALRAGMGIELVPIKPDEVVERYRGVERDRIARLEAVVRDGWLFEEDVAVGESLERSLRAALALEDVVADHRLDAGAFNCHVAQFRFGDEIGIAPCWGLGRLTTAGVPWTCTGDVVTAVAMLTTKRLGGAALYHEIEAIDYATGEVVIANSGEHDLAWLAPGTPPRMRRNGWFCGKDPRCGVCAVLEPAAGPATLVGFTPHPRARGGFRYVVARGELTARRFPETGTPNGAFRFNASPVEQAWAAWAAAGVNHHSSATPGDMADDVVRLAEHLGIEAVVI